MSKLRPRNPRGAPHNPELRDLIENKRKWSSPPKREDAVRGFRGWSERGYLPHRDEPNLTQFVTFQLLDAFPESLRTEWEHFLKIEQESEQRKRLEAYLDKGRGRCHLQHSALASLVENALLHFHSKRYLLKAWVIMPNHVHVLFHIGETPMRVILKSWKGYTATECNSLLGTAGLFWAPDYWDTYMRDSEHERTTVRYIENNPVKARLALNPATWAWSSARLRDKHGALQL